MAKQKKLSNPFSTGGGGVHFEAHVQASFVALMLAGGNAPCLHCWPIAEIKLQGKIDGFDADDLVVVIESVNSKERRKLLGQVKHSIAITHGSTLFGEVMQAAWNDFKNPKVFTRDKDIIALITGPLSATDAHNVQWLLNQAKHTKNVDEFFRNVQQTNFRPPKIAEKLEVIQHHLKAANGGNDVSRDELYDFLNNFHLLGYDLGNEFGVVLSLLHSHISQFQLQYPQWVWSRIVDIVQTWNQDAGTITTGKLPEDLLDAFKQKAVAEMPEEFKAAQEKPKTDWTQHPDATYLALAILIGSWQDKSQCDLEAITKLLGSHLESVFSQRGTGWVDTTLEQVLAAQPQNGWSPPAANHADSGTPVLTLSSVTGFRFNAEKRKYTSAFTNSQRSYWVKNGDFLMTRSNTPEQVGHVAIAEGIDEPTIYPDLIMRMNPDQSRITTEFLYFQMRTQALRKEIKCRAQGANPTMKKISNGAVKTLPIAVTDIATQKEIVNTLNMLSEETQHLSSIYERKLSALEELKTSLLHQAFNGEL
jgi:hypothetical protein